MKPIKLLPVNIRYLVFEQAGAYFILDRCPRHLLGYLFFPLNWLFRQKIYAINREEYIKLKEKHNQNKIGISTTFVAGLAIVFSHTTRRYLHLFATDFTFLQNIFIYLIALVLASIGLYFINRRACKSITKKVTLTSKPVMNQQLFPIWDKNLVLPILLSLFPLLTGGIIIILQFYIGNWVYIAGGLLHIFLFLMLSSNLAYITRCSYRL